MLIAIISAVGLLAALGLIFGVVLGYASKKFAVESDPRIEQISAILPGANCGGCGLPGCNNFAEAVVRGDVAIDACPVGKGGIAAQIAGIMGVEYGGSGQAMVAMVMCQGGKDQCADKFEYSGIQSCQAANLIAGGPKSCKYGCLGYGSCVDACQFGAMHMSESGLPVVDPDLCTACGKCVKACPRALVVMVPADKPVQVRCMSHAKGPEVRKTCKVGCIGCGICAKNCPSSAIEVRDFLAVIDSDECQVCDICIEKCPMKTITNDKLRTAGRAPIAG